MVDGNGVAGRVDAVVDAVVLFFVCVVHVERNVVSLRQSVLVAGRMSGVVPLLFSSASRCAMIFSFFFTFSLDSAFWFFFYSILICSFCLFLLVAIDVFYYLIVVKLFYRHFYIS